MNFAWNEIEYKLNITYLERNTSVVFLVVPNAISLYHSIDLMEQKRNQVFLFFHQNLKVSNKKRSLKSIYD